MAGAIRPNRPARMPEVPVKIKEESAGASKSAAPVTGKGKEIVKLTDKEQAKLNAKIEKSEMKAAMEASIISENKRTGAGPSGTAGESLPSSPASSKGTLGRSQTFPASSPSSSGVSLSDISLGSTPPDSPVPSWIEGRTPHGSETSSKYFTASDSFGSTSGSEPSTPRASEPTTSGTSRLSRSMSESSVSSFSLNDGNIIEFQRDMKALKGRTIEPGVWHTRPKVVLNEPALAGGKKVVDKVIPPHYEPGKVVQPDDPLNFIHFPNGREAKRLISLDLNAIKGGDPMETPVQINIGSGPSTPAVRPTADQDGRPTFPESTSLASLLASKSTNSSNRELPHTKLPDPQQQPKHSNLKRNAIIGLSALAGGAAGFGVAPFLLGGGADANDDQSNAQA